MKWLSFIFGEQVYKLNSLIVTWIFRWRGVSVGSGLYIQGVPKLKIKGRAQDIILGDNVKILGDIDLRNRERGRILIEDGVVLDEGCRLIAANNATLRIGKDSRIGLYTVINCGADITLGSQVLVSGFCYLQSSNHGFKKGAPIMLQKHTYGNVSIESDAWLGSHVTVLPGVTIGTGSVVGAKSVVTKNIKEYGIYVGIPAVEIGERE